MINNEIGIFTHTRDLAMSATTAAENALYALQFRYPEGVIEDEKSAFAAIDAAYWLCRAAYDEAVSVAQIIDDEYFARTLYSCGQDAIDAADRLVSYCEDWDHTIRR